MKDFGFDRMVDRKGTNSYKYDGLKEVFGTEDVLPMWVADMDFRVAPAVSEAIKRRAAHEIYGYTFRPDSYYNSICRWMEVRHHWHIGREWIRFSPGVVPALNMIIQAFTQPGEGVILQSPVYNPFFHAIELNHRKLLNNRLLLCEGRYVMDFDDLAQKAKEAKLLLLSNPHNPVGRSWTLEELQKLGGICLENNVLVISDEIHADLTLPGYRHIMLASVSDEIASNAITCIAPSKTFNLAGLSTSSVIISNPDHRGRYMEMVESLHLDLGNLFGMIASEAAYTYGSEWLDALLIYLQGNVNFVRSFLEDELPEIRMTPIEATYLLWLDFHATGMDAATLNDFMIRKAKVGSNDGSMYGPGGEGFQRLNIACPRNMVQEAFERIKKALKK